MQFQSDLLGVFLSIRPAAILETTALGAAYLAGLATGYLESPQEIWSKRKPDVRFEPSRSDASVRHHPRVLVGCSRALHKHYDPLEESRSSAPKAGMR